MGALAWTALVLVLTLTPSSDTPELSVESFLCVACGWGSSADMIRNWLLFIPLGVLMAALVGPARAAVGCALLTMGIETTQLWVAGRDPTLRDLLFNGLGGASGAWVVWRGLTRPTSYALTAGAVATWLAPVALLAPWSTEADLFGQWTPRLESVEHYRGRVLSATVASTPVASGLLEQGSAIERSLLSRARIEVVMTVGPPTSGYAPVLQVVDRDAVTLLTFGVLGEDLMLRGGNRAEAWRLDQPSARWSGALAGVAVGDTVRITIDRGREAGCMTVEDLERCGVAPSLGDGWGHILRADGTTDTFRTLLGVTWTFALGALLGILAPSVRSGLVRGTGMALVGLAAAFTSPDVSADLLQSVTIVVASAWGAWVRLGAALRRQEGKISGTSRGSSPKKRLRARWSARRTLLI